MIAFSKLCIILFCVSSAFSNVFDVKIDVKQSALTANVTWNLPTGLEVEYTNISLWDSTGQQRLTDSLSPTYLQYMLPEEFQQCKEYSVHLEFSLKNNERLRTPNYKFAMAETRYVSRIGNEISVEWQAQSKIPYSVKAPSGYVIYEVSPSGKVTPGADRDKYLFGQNVSSRINVTVRQVNESDAGLYTSVYKFGHGTPDQCAFLIVKVPPIITDVQMDTHSFPINYSSYSFEELGIHNFSVGIQNVDLQYGVFFYKIGTPQIPVVLNKSGPTLSFQRNELQCEDSGEYIIEVSNGMTSTKRSILLDIQCQPKDVKLTRDRIGTFINAVETISVMMIANPKPEIQWNRITGHNWTITTTKNQKQVGLSQIAVYNESSFGNYGLTICNNFGCTEMNVTLFAGEIASNIKTVVAGALSAATALLLILIAIIIIKCKQGTNGNKRNTQAQCSDVQANQVQEQAEVNYENEAWQASLETSSDHCNDQLGHRADGANTYEAMGYNTSKGLETPKEVICG